MIQVNLLPDLKLQYIKSNRNKKLVISVATLVSLAAVGAVTLMALHVYVNQSIHTKRLQTDIDEKVTQLQTIEDLSTILTVNEQLSSLPTLHNEKPVLTRYSKMLQVIMPSNVVLSESAIDFTELTITFTGKGNGQKAVNVFADILKNTKFSNVSGDISTPAFTNVVFDIGIADEDGLVGFESKMIFDQEIFNGLSEEIFWSIKSVVTGEQATDDTTTLETNEEGFAQ